MTCSPNSRRNEMLPRQSDEIDKLTTAFIEARKSFKPFKEDSNANYGKYVSIDEIKYCTNDSLLANGLSLTQERTIVDGQVVLVTQLTHSSGQWRASYVPLCIVENPKSIDQAYGSSMTYQRRYELYGLFAFKGEELDPDADTAKPTSYQSQYINDKQVALINMLAKSKPDMAKDFLEKLKIDEFSQLPKQYADRVIKALKG